MSITIAGILFFVYLIYLLLEAKLTFYNLFVFTLFCEMYIEIGYAIQIGGFINYRTIAEFVLFLFCLNNINLRAIPNRILVAYVTLMIALVIPVLQLFFFPSDQLVAIVGNEWDKILVEGASPKHPVLNGYVVQMLIQFGIQGIVLVYMLTNFEKISYLRLMCKIDQMINCMLILGLLEFVIVSVFRQNELWGTIKLGVFGFSEGTYWTNRMRAGLYELTLFTKETSHYANVLLYSFFFKSAYNLVIKKRIIDKYLILNFMIMAVGMSFSSLLCAFCIFVVLMAYRWRILRPSTRRYEQTLIMFSILFLLVLFSTIISTLNSEGFFSRRIVSLIEEIDIVTSNMWMLPGVDSLEWSNRVRLLSIYQTLLAFIHRPLFGYGIGAVCCHGATAMMLAGCGVIGLYVWSKFVFFSQPLIKIYRPEKVGYLISFLMFLFVTIFYSNGVKAFYELSAIMLAISFCVIFSKRKKCKYYIL